MIKKYHDRFIQIYVYPKSIRIINFTIVKPKTVPVKIQGIVIIIVPLLKKQGLHVPMPLQLLQLTLPTRAKNQNQYIN